MAEGVRVLAAPEGWGDVAAEDVRGICQEAADLLIQHVEPAPAMTVLVFPGDVVRALREHGPNGERRIQLTARDTHWCRYVLQFAHELAHFLVSDHPTQADDSWVEEVLCHAASYFVLRRMGPRWAVGSDPARQRYALHFAPYADDDIARARASAGLDGPFPEWLRERLPALRADCCRRDDNDVIAAHLLPVLERHPEAWSTLRYLGGVHEHLADPLPWLMDRWRERCPEGFRPHVARLTAALLTEGEGA